MCGNCCMLKNVFQYLLEVQNLSRGVEMLIMLLVIKKVDLILQITYYNRTILILQITY